MKTCYLVYTVVTQPTRGEGGIASYVLHIFVDKNTPLVTVCTDWYCVQLRLKTLESVTPGVLRITYCSAAPKEGYWCAVLQRTL